MNYFIPETNTDFVCIVDRAQTGFAAVILSYLAKPNYYLPLFEFSEVTIANTDVEDDFIDEHVITRNRAREFNILMSNSISKLRTCKNVILAGLSNEQRSYLDFPKGFNVIEIQSMHEVDFFLGEYATEKKEIISCTGDNLLEGLFTALNSQAKLKIDENANLLIYRH